MEHPREMTVVQATAILISTMTGVGVLGLPRFAVEAGYSGAPLVTLFGVLLAFGGLTLLSILGRRFPEQSIIRYSEVILGKWPARFGSVCLIIFFLTLTGLTSREFGIVVKTFVLRNTPLEIPVMVMLFLAAVSTRQDRNTFVYIHLFYIPFILFPGMVIVPFTLEHVQPIYLLPVWGGDLRGMFGGTLTVAALLQGSFVLTMIIPAMRQPNKALTASLWGIGVSGVVYVVIVVMAVAVFGHEEIKLMLWPTLELARAGTLPVFERLDAALLIGWVLVVFTTLYSTYFITVHAVSELFHLRDHRVLVPFVFPLVFLIALLPQNVEHLYDIALFVGKAGLCLTIVYPLLLFVTALVRGRRGGSHVKAD